MTAIGSSEGGQLLIDDVLVPLVLGGTVVPLPHVDSEQAPDVVRAAMQLFTPATAARVDLQRVRVARRLAPVDTAPAIDGNIWGMLLAFSNMLRSSDPENDGLFSPGRSVSIADSAERILENVSPPTSALDALGRHTVFSQVLSVRRLELKVSWWCGSEKFVGREAPERLLAWPDLRHVHVQREHPPLLETIEAPESDPKSTSFLRALRRLLHLCPLTDLSTITRNAPVFTCSQSTLQLLADPHGRVLALRTLRQVNPGQAAEKLTNACVDDKEFFPRSAPVRDVQQQLQRWARL